MKMHEAHTYELEYLHQNLPDFGEFQEAAYDHVYHVKLHVSGCANWYHNSGTSRYFPEGFIVPQHEKKREGITPQTAFVKK